MWVPNSVFDDRLLCMQWQNKNQDNAQVDIDNLIENEIKEKTLSAPKQYNTENTVQIKEMSTDNPIKLYPNPANTQVNIRYKNANDTKLQIVNILGIVITEIDLPKDIQNVSINVSNLVTGVYIYRQIQNKTQIKAGKLIITN